MNDLLRGWPTLIVVAGVLTGATTIKRIIAALPTFKAEITKLDKPTRDGYVAEVANLVIRTQCQRYWLLAQAAIPVAIVIVAQLYVWRHSTAYTAGLRIARHSSPFAGWFMTFGLFVPWASMITLVFGAYDVWLRRPSLYHTKDMPINLGPWRSAWARSRTDIADRNKHRKHNSSNDA